MVIFLYEYAAAANEIFMLHGSGRGLLVLQSDIFSNTQSVSEKGWGKLKGLMKNVVHRRPSLGCLTLKTTIYQPYSQEELEVSCWDHSI